MGHEEVVILFVIPVGVMPVKIAYPYYMGVWCWIKQSTMLLMEFREGIYGNIVLTVVVYAEKGERAVQKGKMDCHHVVGWKGYWTTEHHADRVVD